MRSHMMTPPKQQSNYSYNIGKLTLIRSWLVTRLTRVAMDFSVVFKEQKTIRMFFAIVLLGVSQVVVALDYSFTSREPINGSDVDKYQFLLMKGKIEPGDYRKLLQFLKNDVTEFAKGRQIIISSPGGDVHEAMKIGDFVRKSYTQVNVGPYHGKCLSSCFLILASAVSRDWWHQQVGLHRPYLTTKGLEGKSATQAIEQQEQGMIAVEDYLARLRVPSNLIDVMIATPSNQIVWLDEPGKPFGRYAPSYEQLLVTKCGLDTALEKRFFSGDKRVAVSKVLEARNCGERLTFKEGMNYLVSELGGTPPF